MNINKYLFNNRLESFVNSSEVNGELHVYLYGLIGGEHVTSADIINELNNKIDNYNEIILHLNSDGGDVKEGLCIYDYLSKFSDKLNVIVEGAACSISSIIALAGKSLKMTPNSYYMIHLPYVDGVSGTSHDLTAMSSILTKMENTLVNIYTEKFKKPVEEIYKKLIKETWFTPTEAIEYGICNDIYFGKFEMRPLNCAQYSNLNEITLKNILKQKSIKELIKMKDKVKDELLKIKAELKVLNEMAEEISEDEPKAEYKEDEEIKNEVMEEKPMIEEEQPQAETDQEEMVEPEAEMIIEEEPTIGKELITEIVEILKDDEGSIASEDLLEVMEIKDPVAALKAAAIKGKARILNSLKMKNTRNTTTTINKQNINAKSTSEGKFDDRRIDFSRLPKMK